MADFPAPSSNPSDYKYADLPSLATSEILMVFMFSLTDNVSFATFLQPF